MKHDGSGQGGRPECEPGTPGASGAGETDAALGRSPQVMAYFGSHYRQAARFAELLAHEGVRRGLIGPGEVDRLWTRHILNSAAVVPYLPVSGTVIDVGSGAGLPGVILAIMRPDLRTLLVEPMERRVAWLEEVVSELGLTAEVVRARAEELHGDVVAEAVTARAVAPMSRLVPWTLPLLTRGGVLLAMKGKRAAEEVRAALPEVRRAGGGQPEILEVGTVDGAEPTTLVRVARETAGPEPGPARGRRA